MREDKHFIHIPIIEINAAQIGMSKARWKAVKENQSEAAAIQIMAEHEFDVLPIENVDGTITHYFQTRTPKDYKQIQKRGIEGRDKMYYLTHVRDLVRQFVETGRTFFFLTNHKEIMGLVTNLNLPSRPCHLYFYNLVNDLELRLGDFVGYYVRNRFIEDFLQQKESKDHAKSRANHILEEYYEDKAKNQDPNLIEYLYFTHFAELIQAQKLTTYLGFSSTRQLEQATARINEVRNWVAHPVSSSTANLPKMLLAFLHAYDTFIEGFESYESKQELIQNFRETSYLIYTHKKGPRQEIIIKIGAANQDLNHFLHEKDISKWAFITAYNPMGRQVSDAANQQAMQSLESDLRNRFRRPGVGLSQDGTWSEPSFFVGNIERADATQLMKKYNQLAIVFGERDQIAELLFDT